MINVREFNSDRLSTFRTTHRFLHYGEFQDVDQYREYLSWAREREIPLFILGNGSNTLFRHRRVKTLVLKNRLKPWLRVLDDGRIEASSSLPVMTVLKHCERNGLDSFYFLASVPATLGGALAMNAGLGVGPTIYDFVESVTYFDGDRLVVASNDDIHREHRQTMFTGIHHRLIVSAVLRFEPVPPPDKSAIRERIEWCHANQDLSSPNCGTVFRECYRPLMRWFPWLVPWGIHWPFFKAQYSRKVNVWIINRNRHSWAIVCLIRLAQLMHRAIGKRALLELIEVE